MSNILHKNFFHPLRHLLHTPLSVDDDDISTFRFQKFDSAEISCVAFSEEVFLLINFSCLSSVSESSKHGLNAYHEDDSQFWCEDILVERVNLFEAHTTSIALIDIGGEVTARREYPNIPSKEGCSEQF